MAAKSEFRKYVDTHQDLPPEVILGHIAWFHISDGRFDPKHIESEFARLGLNAQFLPKAINPADGWEKATKEIQGTKYAIPGTDHRAELMVRDVTRDKERIVRHVVREVRDSRGVRLTHSAVAEIVFYKAQTRGGVVDHSSVRERAAMATGVPVEEQHFIRDALAVYADAYQRFTNYHDGQRIRVIARDYLLYLNGVALKAGVYFVHSNRQPELLRLQEFMKSLAGCTLALCPLADIPSMREEVVSCFEREAVKDFTNVVSEIQTLYATRSGNLSSAAYAKVLRQYQSVMSKSVEYGRNLQLSQDHTAAAAEAARDALQKLQDDVVAGAAAKGK